MVTLLFFYRQTNPGLHLYQAYFEATPHVGQGITRAAAAPSGEYAVLEQGKRYHQAGQYDYALTSLRSYLTTQPIPADYLPELLAGTAAMATGNYAEARRYLQELPTEDTDADAAALWYLSLLDLHDENLDAAQGKLQLLTASPAARQYPVDELLAKIEKRI